MKNKDIQKSGDNFLIFLSCSITFHLVILYFFLFGMPSLFEKLPEEQIIAFEMLPISDKSNIITQKKQKEIPVENEDAKKSEQSKPKTTEEQKLPEVKPLTEEKPKEEPPKTQEEKPIEKEKEVIPEEKPQVKEEKTKEEEKPVEKKEIPEKKLEEKPKEIKKKEKNTDDLDSLLKNLEQSSEGNNIKSNKYSRAKQENKEKESKGSHKEDSPLSISETALIKKQIERHWNNIPAGVRNNNKVRVVLNIVLDKVGNVEQVKTKEAICPNIAGSVCEALADSATRAVWQASPIENLDPARFNHWKEINFSFDPSKL
ncbi:energy transducer TonB [Rickettsia endosymbiont of Halotydeus destructor]|uniref:energy transducer TonB n=1 Tax=Rickettsia endosymbiont of Halotydeus destructor TaxID=2996754 RepID=UPI003BB03D79